MAAPSVQEQHYYDQLFAAVDKDSTGLLPGADALPLLSASGLPQQTLGEVWAVADPDNNGFLTKEGWYRAARVIGWLQKGNQTQVDNALVNKPGPYPTFSGYPAPPQQLTPAQTPLSANSTGTSAFPPLTAADRTKFTRIFVGCGPSNGLVSGDKARDVFLKSKLSYDKLGQIWNLADTQERGALDLPDFIIGMYLIQSCMANPALTLPSTLPPGTYEAASGGRPPALTTISRSSTVHPGPTSPIQRQLTGTLQPQMTGQSFTTATAATPPRPSTRSPSRQSTGPPFPTASHNVGGNIPWDVTPEAKATSDRFFSQLDTQNKGAIDGDVAVPFMLQSQLDEGSLASIWDLADIRQEGKLDRSEFAVAMHLINNKLAGKELPSTVPFSLIPPHLRNQTASAQPSAAAVPSASKDLFDLFDDAPEPASSVAPTLQAFLPPPPSRRPTQEPTGVFNNSRQHSVFGPVASPQPAGDLLGEDTHDAPAAVLDRSADIGNKKNELENTNRSVSELEKTRAELEQSASASASQLAILEANLSTARTKHESESTAVSGLRVRVGEQTTQLKQLEADVISAESDLTAMKLEKDELEQSLLRDKEEVRGLQGRMKELEEEKTGLKLLLDKLKKEARQQKGMVTIAKKQLSTAEGSRDAVQQEVRDTEKAMEAEEATDTVAASVSSPTIHAATSATLATAVGVPLPRTPQSLTPEATGASQRSNNPFDRFGKSPPPGQGSGSEHLHVGTAAVLGGVGAGAAAGIAAGAFGMGSGAAHHTEEPAPIAEAAADPFGMPVGDAGLAAVAVKEDPFGVPTSNRSTNNTAFGDDSFGDSFSSAPVAPSVQQPAGSTDFDAAFADFDDEPSEPRVENQAPQQPEVMGPPIPFGSTMATHGGDIRPEAERTASTQVIAPSSNPQRPSVESAHHEMAATAPPVGDDEAESSDDDEGPEDADGPKHDYSRQASPPTVTDVPHTAPTAAVSAPVAAGAAAETVASPAEDHKVRRSAPPPPIARGSAHSGLASPTKAASISSPVTSIGQSAITAPPEVVVDPFGAPLSATTRETETVQSPVPTTQPTVDPFGAPLNDAVPMEAAAVLPVTHSTPANTETDPFDAPFGSAHANQPISEPTATGSLDPFGAPVASSAAPAAAAAATSTGLPHPVPKTSQFDDEDDFDFSDLPPAHPTATPQATNPNSAFDDEFASFEDDFENPTSQTHSGSDNSNSILQTYEVVSPPKAAQEQAERGLDEWGIGSNAAAHSGVGHSNALSFDDAFGGDFEPTHAAPSGAATTSHAETSAPPIPDRPDLPQADDLDDVKKLCSMGFSRSLVVGALDANGYDFQKALNVLLDK